MDITKLNSVDACEKGSWLDIKDPQGYKTGIRVKVVGIDSKRYKQESQRMIKYLERIKDEKDKDYDEMEIKSIAMAVALSVDWENVEEDGKTVEFNKTDAERFYTLAPIIPTQILNFAKDRSNFLSVKQED